MCRAYIAFVTSAARKGRTTAAVIKKAHAIRKKQGLKPRVKRLWTDEERRELVAKGREPGYIERIAEKTGRAPRSVLKKYYEFRKAGY